MVRRLFVNPLTLDQVDVDFWFRYFSTPNIIQNSHNWRCFKFSSSVQFKFICGSFDFPRLYQWQGKYQWDNCFWLGHHLHNIIDFTSIIAINKDDALLAMVFVHSKKVYMLQLLMWWIHCIKMIILAKWAASELKLNWTEQFETSLFDNGTQDTTYFVDIVMFLQYQFCISLSSFIFQVYFINEGGTVTCALL